VADAGLRAGGSDDDGFAEIRDCGEESGQAGGFDTVVVAEKKLHPGTLARRTSGGKAW
jgi:hypothetical protein